MSSTSKKDGNAASSGSSQPRPITIAAPEFSFREGTEPFRNSSVRESMTPESHSESISPSISSNLFVIKLPETIEYLSAPSPSLPLPSSAAALLPINETTLPDPLASSLPSSATMSISTGQYLGPVEQTTNSSPSLSLTTTPSPPPAIDIVLVPGKKAVVIPLQPSNHRSLWTSGTKY
ncbi:hypothetical protein DL96DRAFT_1606969 [Flagelloscypha sp. PMI_526]|nr:hypothetical protein DL96DRAFT_1606969 [Flagelloscypha sp. PMI_526]